MSGMWTRVFLGGLVGVVVVTIIGLLFTPASPNQSLTIGLIAGTLLAATHWFLEEQRRGNI